MNLEEQIETLRAELVVLVMEKNSFVDESVIATSQQLDKLIIELQQQKMVCHLSYT